MGGEWEGNGRGMGRRVYGYELQLYAHFEPRYCGALWLSGCGPKPTEGAGGKGISAKSVRIDLGRHGTGRSFKPCHCTAWRRTTFRQRSAALSEVVYDRLAQGSFCAPLRTFRSLFVLEEATIRLDVGVDATTTILSMNTMETTRYVKYAVCLPCLVFR